MDDFEWDDDKNNTNIEVHHIDFDDAISIFCGYTLNIVDNRRDYGEERVVAYGETDGRVLALVFTMRGCICRVISARKANRNERAKYYTAFSEQPPDRSD